ncbi:uncharacterized protein EV422DRAFT_508698 [Fimicolochytrium jonesii]|uniref:uncharacterized protein n=1 Tax=Fimicolochytrium jonesii TaxID=1396493 RepID=UPI0022FE6092|nr:uncharacterized protein EV422DRAFT_508698 [Fimicolochytrium jonesii]KAI8817876.1 hypothetical protein EV422DRAFT_508698 [Fimicolochytrium jonesii]
MAAQSKLGSTYETMLAELFRLMADCMPLESVRSFRLTARAVTNSVDDVYLFTRFYAIFPELRKFGDDFALALVRAREDHSKAWNNFLTDGSGLKLNIHSFFKTAILKRDTTMIAWILVAADHLKGSVRFHFGRECCYMTVADEWYLGTHMAWTFLRNAWAAVDGIEGRFRGTGVWLHWLGEVVCKLPDEGKETACFHFLRKCLHDMVKRPWDSADVQIFLDAFEGRAQSGLTARAMDAARGAGITFDLTNLQTHYSHRDFLNADKGRRTSSHRLVLPWIKMHSQWDGVDIVPSNPKSLHDRARGVPRDVGALQTEHVGSDGDRPVHRRLVVALGRQTYEFAYSVRPGSAVSGIALPTARKPVSIRADIHKLHGSGSSHASQRHAEQVPRPLRPGRGPAGTAVPCLYRMARVDTDDQYVRLPRKLVDTAWRSPFRLSNPFIPSFHRSPRTEVASSLFPIEETTPSNLQKRNNHGRVGEYGDYLMIRQVTPFFTVRHANDSTAGHPSFGGEISDLQSGLSFTLEDHS